MSTTTTASSSSNLHPREKAAIHTALTTGMVPPGMGKELFCKPIEVESDHGLSSKEVKDLWNKIRYKDYTADDEQIAVLHAPGKGEDM